MKQHTNYYKDLRQIDISKAINEIVELALPRGTQNKLLTVNVRLDIENYKTETGEIKEINLVYYRPSNYTFVGAMDDCRIGVDTNIKYLSYHDSCWRSDGTERYINDQAYSLAKKYEGKKGYSVYTTFGLHGMKLVDGTLNIDRESFSALVIPNKNA